MENNSYQTPPQDNYYQNLYNMFGGYNPILDKKACDIRRLAMFAGGACIVYILLQNLFVVFLSFMGLVGKYQRDVVFQNCANIICQVFSMLIPFFFVYYKSSEDEKNRIMIFDRPKDIKLSTLAVCAGLAICLCSNFIGNIILSLFSVSGVEFSSGSENAPVGTGILGYISMILGYAFIPALIEEFTFRGVILQPLRKYGDRFAIVMSAILFALMHGNMVQAPVALIAGIALGYFCIATGSIWTSIAIHFSNNLVSTLLTIYYEVNPVDEASNSDFPIYIIVSAIIAIGVAAFFTFRRMNEFKTVKGDSEINSKMKARLYLCAPTVVLCIVYSLYTTLSLQQTSKFTGVVLLVALIVAIAVIIVKSINRINADTRFNLSGKYTASKIFIIISAIALSFLVLTLSLAGRINIVQ